MESILIFNSEKDVRFKKLLKFIIPTYLTSLFTTVYTIIDGIFVSAYVGTNALASINIVYPIVNVLTGIALVFATGGSAVTALHIGGNYKKRSWSFNVIKLRNGIFERNTKNVLLFFFYRKFELFC